MIETSMPISADGIKPKAPRTLNLPPTFGFALITLNPALREAMSNGDCGSVTMIMCSVLFKPASVKRVSKKAL
ncbi:unannotated protein [freshwater metagenome]|uniref:Unannotated protein n=1 Tax=freshwater metagenome TaxID=449393 RepID=A0A6J6IDK3_9ZZZZ